MEVCLRRLSESEEEGLFVQLPLLRTGTQLGLCSALSVPGWLTSALEPLRNKHAQPPELEGMLLGNQEMWLSLRDGLGIETA